jgi:signal transduction histidine kinase
MNQALEEAESYAPRPAEDHAALRAVVPMNQLLGGADSHAQLAAEDPAAARPIAPMNRQLGEAESPAPRPADDLDAEPAEPDSLAVHTVEIGSIAGRLVDPQFLVLHRTAILNGAVYRQGLVLDVPALAGWVADEVLGGTPLLGEARLELIAAINEPSSALFAGDVVYRHRFADPFDSLAVAMALPALADVGFNYLYPISLLLVVAGIAGLLALYRTVSVSLAFAERRNNFVAAVSHELKTPLTSIRMYGEMLRDGMVASEEKRAEYFATITAESERLTRLINNVLEFSRLEQGNREMSLVVGSIAPVVEEAARLLGPHARGLGFAIEVEIEDDLPAVRFDRDAVLQVLFNLVDNALKYARSSGDRRIALRCLRAGSGVMLAVRDRGPGVADRHLSKIFEPFYRGEEELTRTAKGTGIGLALVKGLGERMGAAVRFQNADEGGFEVSLSFRPA